MRRIKLKPMVRNILILGSIFLAVTIAGLILSFVNSKNFIYLESFYMLTGTIIMLIALFNSRSRDNKNFKEKKTIFEDETKPEYKEYKNFQKMLWIFGLFCVGASLLVFFLLNW